MIVDSFKFLPRSFRPLYEAVAVEDDSEVWAPFEKRLSAARIALLTSAGLYVESDQEPFDLDGERRQPTWGDPTHREIPSDVGPARLGMCHLHVNNDDVVADPNIALPVPLLEDLRARGVVGGVAPTHYSVMGYQEAGLSGWRNHTGPAITRRLQDEAVDGLVLAPV